MGSDHGSRNAQTSNVPADYPRARSGRARALARVAPDTAASRRVSRRLAVLTRRARTFSKAVVIASPVQTLALRARQGTDRLRRDARRARKAGAARVAVSRLPELLRSDSQGRLFRYARRIRERGVPARALPRPFCMMRGAAAIRSCWTA